MTEQKLSIFDFLKSVTYTKEDLSTNELFNKIYDVYQINSWLSMSQKTVDISYFLTKKTKISKIQHYKFLLHFLKKEFIKFNYQKENKEDKEQLKTISEYYNVNLNEAKTIEQLLSKERLERINKSYGRKNDAWCKSRTKK